MTSLQSIVCTPRAGNRFSLHDLDISEADLLPIWYLLEVVHVAGWDPCNPHDLAKVSWVGPVYYVQIMYNLSQWQVRT